MKVDRKCLLCGTAITGRTDKKFCGDYCRNQYNYEQNRQNTNLIRKINGRLKRNYTIMADFNTHGKARIRKTDMIDRGFNFNYFTNEYVTRSGRKYRFVYSQGYLVDDDEWVTLVMKQDYVE